MTMLTTMILAISSFFGIAEEYEKSQTQIEQAVEARDFHQVKELLIELMPVLEEDIRKSKKYYGEVKKSAEKEEVKLIKEKLNRKVEIHDDLDHLLEVSPAAVRVRSSQIVKLVKELNELSK